MGERISLSLHTFQQCCRASCVIKHKVNKWYPAISVSHQVSWTHLCIHSPLKTLFIMLFLFLYTLFYFHFLIHKCITANIKEKKLIEKNLISEITKAEARLTFKSCHKKTYTSSRETSCLIFDYIMQDSHVLFALYKWSKEDVKLKVSIGGTAEKLVHHFYEVKSNLATESEILFWPILQGNNPKKKVICTKLFMALRL